VHTGVDQTRHGPQGVNKFGSGGGRRVGGHRTRGGSGTAASDDDDDDLDLSLDEELSRKVKSSFPSQPPRAQAVEDTTLARVTEEPEPAEAAPPRPRQAVKAAKGRLPALRGQVNSDTTAPHNNNRPDQKDAQRPVYVAVLLFLDAGYACTT
jgi:hypothetical protein